MEHGKQKHIEEVLQQAGSTYSNAYNLTSLPVHDISTLKSEYHQIYPSYNIKDSGDLLEFDIPVSNTHYTNLAKTFLYLRFKVTKSDGTNLANDSKTSIGNLPFSSIFKNIEIYINNILCSTSTNNYAYTAYINRIINSTNVDKDTKLQCELYVPSTHETPVDDSNKMYSTLKDKTKESKSIELYSTINHSIFEIKKYFPPGVSIKIRMRLQSNNFCLFGAKSTDTVKFTDKLVLQESYLDVFRSIANTRITQLYESLLGKNSRIFYPYKEREVFTYAIDIGNITHVSQTLLHKVPSFCMVGITSADAYYGAPELNPYEFKPYNLISASLLVNGEKQMHPNFKFSVDDKQFIKLYRSLFSFPNAEGSTMNISQDEFTKFGYFLVPLYYTDDSMKQDRKCIGQPADIKVSLEFSKASTVKTMITVYFVYDKLLSLDRDSVYIE